MGCIMFAHVYHVMNHKYCAVRSTGKLTRVLYIDDYLHISNVDIL